MRPAFETVSLPDVGRGELCELFSTLSQLVQRATGLGWRNEAVALYLSYFFLL